MVPKIIKIKNILKQWKKRNLTPIGKITVLKTLVLSKLNHIFISLPLPSEQKLKEIEKIFFSFIWDDKPERIKREQIMKDYSEGGLKMVNIRNFIKSLKLAWVRRLLFEDKSWKNIILQYIDLEKMFTCGPEYGVSYLPTHPCVLFWL